jgi:hypothetical protein
MRGTTIAAIICGACFLVGCGDPIVGEWELDSGSTATQEDWTIEGDETGEFEATYNISGTDVDVDGDIEWSNEGDGEYEVELKCKSISAGLSCSQVSTSKLDCEINDAGDELECSIGTGDKFTYDKK